MGVAIGITLGATFRYNVSYLTNLGRIKSNKNSILILQRSVVGLLFLVLQRFLSKKFLSIAIKTFHYLKYKNEKKVELKELIQNNYKLEMLYYIFIYGGIGFSAVLPAFCLFEYLNLI